MSGIRQRKRARTDDVSREGIYLLLRAIEATEEEPQQVSTAQRGASVVVNNGVDNTVVINNVAEDHTLKILSDCDKKADRAYRGVRTCDERTIKTMDRVRTLENKHVSMQDVIHNIDVRLTKVEAPKAAHGATMELFEGVKEAQARLEKEVKDLKSEVSSQRTRMADFEGELSMQPQYGLDIDSQNKTINALKNRLDALERMVGTPINHGPAQAQPAPAPPAPPPGQDDRIRAIVRAGLRAMSGAEKPTGMTVFEEDIYNLCVLVASVMQETIQNELTRLERERTLDWGGAVIHASKICLDRALESAKILRGSVRNIHSETLIILDEFVSMATSWPVRLRDEMHRKAFAAASASRASGGRGT